MRLPGHKEEMLPYAPQTVAEAILSLLDAAASNANRASLAIPGGRSPGPVLTCLAAAMDPYLRSRLHLLWVDERAVPVGDPQRNDGPTLAAWRAGGPLPAHVHPMPAEATDLEGAATRYAAVLTEATAGAGLDVALLGLGEDGHIASLFPRHAGLTDLSDVIVITDSPKPPPRRLSLSLGVLHRTRQVLILALGEAKGRVMAAARAGADPLLPVSLLPPARCHWYCDDAAARAAAADQ